MAKTPSRPSGQTPSNRPPAKTQAMAPAKTPGKSEPSTAKPTKPEPITQEPTDAPEPVESPGENEIMPTPVTRTAAARDTDAVTEARLEERRAAARTTTIVAVISGLIIIALVAALIIVFTGAGGNQVAGSGPLAAPQVVPPDGNSTDLTQAAWIQVPGQAKAGALIVDVHFDYQCPYCGLLEKSYDTAFEDLATSGDIILRYHTRTFLDRLTANRSSSLAAMAAACVDIADNTKYVAYHNTVFTNQPQEGTGYTNQQLRSDFATAAGLTGRALTVFQACYDRRATLDWITYSEANNSGLVANPSPPNQYLFGGNAPLYYDKTTGQQTNDTVNGQAAGVSGTPMILVNGTPMSWSCLFDSSGQPKYPATGAGLLPVLQQPAQYGC